MANKKDPEIATIFGTRSDFSHILESLLEATDGISWAVDQNDRLIYHSRKFKSAYKDLNVYAAAGGRFLSNVDLSAEIRKEWKEWYRKASGGASFSIEKEVKSHGTIARVEYSFGPLKDKSSDNTGAIVTARDITDQFISRKVSKLQRKLYSEFLLDQDPDKTLRKCLESALEITGMHCGGFYMPDATGRLQLECSIGAYADFFIASMSDFEAAIKSKFVNADQAVYTGFRDLINPASIVREPGKPLEAAALVPVRLSNDRTASMVLVSHTMEQVPAEKRKVPESLTDSMGILINQGISFRAMRESEKKFRALFEQAPIGIDLVSSDGAPFMVNRALTKIIGRTEKEMITGKVTDWTHPDDREKSLVLMREIISGVRDHFHLKKRYVKGDGSTIWANTYVAAVRNDKGKLNFFIAMVEDISEEYRAVEKINFQAELLANISDAIIASDENFLITYWNEGAERIYGYSREEVLCRPANDILKTEFPGKDHAEQANQLKEKGEFRGEVINYNKKGEKLYVDAYATALHDQEGNQTGYISINRDISERKEMELRLFNSQQLFIKTFSAINDAIFVIDPSKRKVILCNQSVEKVFGFTAEEVTNRSTMMLHIDKAHFESFNKESLPALDRDGVFHGISKMKRKDGKIIDTEHVVTEITDEYGNRQGVVSFVRDITQRLSNEMEVIQKSDQLRSLARHLQDVREEERKYLSREIHDDLGQILSALKMNISCIGKIVAELDDSRQKGKMRPELDDAENILSEAIRKMRQLITELRPEILDYLGLIPALEWQAEEFRKRYNVKTEFKCDADPVTFESDEQITIFRLLQESLNNIAKHAEASKVRVLAEMDNNYFTLRVEDNGKGFEVKKAQTYNTFGLIGMNERMIALGGSMQIDSYPGEGTEIKFEIPLKNKSS